jgi:hypothetical protein
MECEMSDSGYDRLERRCPRLGGPVRFAYCRTAGESGDCCFKVFDCWWEYFDVVAFMRRCLPARQFDQLAFTRAPDKTASLVDIIQQARRRLRDEDGPD